MADTTTIKTELEKQRDRHLKQVEVSTKEAERIARLLEAIDEAEQEATHYLSRAEKTNYGQTSLILPPALSGNIKSDSERARDALLKMPETFTSNDLWETANNDGGPPINKRKSFAPYFTKMKKRKLVVEVQAPVGNKPGIYRKGSEPSTMT